MKAIALKRANRAADGKLEVTEGVVQSAIRLAIGQLPYVRLWRNNVGEMTQKLVNGRSTHVTWGLCKGSSDLIGVVLPFGRFLAIEVKEPGWEFGTDKRHADREQQQADFHAIVERFGGVGGFARSVDEAMELVERARHV